MAKRLRSLGQVSDDLLGLFADLRERADNQEVTAKIGEGIVAEHAALDSVALGKAAAYVQAAQVQVRHALNEIQAVETRGYDRIYRGGAPRGE